MKKLLIAAATLGFAATGAALVGQAQAAPAMDPNCKMGAVAGNSYAVQQSWADHYNCWGHTGSAAAKVRPVAVREPRSTKDPMCKMGAVAGNSYAVQQSWADHYKCW